MEDTLFMGFKPAEDSGIRWLNPFSGEMEVWYNADMTIASQLRAAAERINDLEEEVKAIKAFLAL
ncbi:hypothetical protein CN221_11180 [Sinorhizobium meliloti]|uniref:hypothetical protein n=1 Tax=Rhizobium meliloti TaxID=382 RepID=UPI000FE12152|nr:hypothetical protein [Sinorhizobium meliloti]RVG96706.1 hypothetical protein CN221_11180 [Sinorhizobium meliloti]RVH69415.1 hypothetical protein CN209_02900 [Sinorhizobium meliloti]